MLKYLEREGTSVTDYESWMPDFIGGLANGIEKNKHLVGNAVNALSKDMSIGMNLNSALPSISREDKLINPMLGTKAITQNITINSTSPLSPSEIIKKQKLASRQLAMEWGL